MKRIATSICAAAILFLPTGALLAEDLPAGQQDQQKPKIVAGSVVERFATVKAIDQKSRTITLQMPSGKNETFTVGPAVKRLGEVAVGDRVKATYLEAVTVKINKNKVPAGVSVEQKVKRDDTSATPAGAAALTVTTTATVSKIYDDGKKAILLMPDGTSADVEVRDPENQAKIRSGEIKEGDQVEIAYHRAIALAVEKSGQK